MWRHGDVLIAAIAEIPSTARRRPQPVLAEGELTGHSHRLEDPSGAQVYEFGGERFLRITAESARIVHQEHAPIVLPRGTYRVWIQREYSPEAIRRVVD
jgi:hypothetical protein